MGGADITILQALGLIALGAMAGGLLEWAALREVGEDTGLETWLPDEVKAAAPNSGGGGANGAATITQSGDPQIDRLGSM